VEKLSLSRPQQSDHRRISARKEQSLDAILEEDPNALTDQLRTGSRLEKEEQLDEALTIEKVKVQIAISPSRTCRYYLPLS